MPAIAEAPPLQTLPHRPLRTGRILLVAVAIVLAPIWFEAYRIMLGSNFHVVLPGRFYRCSQPSAANLKELIADCGIRTVVNLRGPCDPFEWYVLEAQATHGLNVCQEDICFSAGRLPAVPEVRRLIEVLERTEYPIVFHCRRGADRTGLAAAIALLLTTDARLDEACQQLGWRYGHAAVGRPGQLDQFLAFYRKWLIEQGKNHSSSAFRDWALHHYRPGSCWSDLEFIQTPSTNVTVGDQISLKVRVRNVSLLPWTFKPLESAGVHLGCHVYDEYDSVITVIRSGLRDALVAPGDSISLTIVVPPLRKPGRYRLQLDMVDEQQCWFFQTGSRPLEAELIVHE